MKNKNIKMNNQESQFEDSLKRVMEFVDDIRLYEYEAVQTKLEKLYDFSKDTKLKKKVEKKIK